MSTTAEDLIQEAFPAVRSQPIHTHTLHSSQGNGTTSHEYYSTPRIQPLSSARILHGQSRSLSAISLRALVLGISLGISVLLTSYYIYHQRLVWRVPFFVGTLSFFHFLEFYMTAVHNTEYAEVAAYLLSQNGTAYNVAHTAALTECLLRIWIAPDWQITSPFILALGLVAIAVGQATRSTAMAHAGTNFNHTVQTHKIKGHKLVTGGIYGWLRHPAYFGFFWWGLGTQIVLGNPICFVAYAFVLWNFFSRRIRKEEEFLVAFFDGEYVTYRSLTPVAIPFIR